MADSVGLISKPASFIRFTKYSVLEWSLSCRSLVASIISNILMPAAATIGGMEFENR